MTDTTYYRRWLDEAAEQGNLRHIPAHSCGDGMLDFSTNDYLGLAARHDLQHAFLSSMCEGAAENLTSSASRLLASDQRAYASLELLLSRLYGRQALLFNSGYHANTGMVSCLADKSTLIAADRLVHASIIDGATLARGAAMRRWRHNDLSHLDAVLRKEAASYQRVIIIVESVYSMDGDRADLKGIVEIKRRYPNAMLYVDEAHALGVEGPDGLGLCAALDPETRSDIDVMIGTLGKACASMGAFAIMSSTLREYALNRARSFIFSTALPPICCAWSERVMHLLPSLGPERKHLHSMSSLLVASLAEMGVTGIEPNHIVPIPAGSAHRALEMARKLADEGIKVLPIRTPTVPPGTERLRVSLSAAHSRADVERLIDALKIVL